MSVLDVRKTLNQTDFTNSHNTQLYGLGYQPSIEHIGNEYMSKYIYIRAGDNIDAYKPIEIDKFFEGNPFENPDYNMQVVIPQFPMLTGQYGFAQFMGKCRCSVKAVAGAMVAGNYAAADDDDVSALKGTLDTNLLNQTVGTVLESIDNGVTKVVDFILLGRGVKILS